MSPITSRCACQHPRRKRCTNSTVYALCIRIKLAWLLYPKEFELQEDGEESGSATLSVDASFAQNDLFYANLDKDLFQHGPFGNRSHTLNYFFPLGYWAFSANYTDYSYHQNIPNANAVLHYSSQSDTLQLTVSRLLYRDQSHKTTLNLRGYRKYSTNAVNDINIDLQKRRTAGWELGLNQRSYLGRTTLDANINLRRGTGVLNAFPAQEEASHSGSARTGMLLGDLSGQSALRLV